MGWKATGPPAVRQQRDRWVVRVDGIDTETGRHRPRQLGTFTSRRGAQRAASEAAASGAIGSNRGTVGWLVQKWVASRTDLAPKTRAQYEWACGHIDIGLGAIPVERLERDDVARWLQGLADGGRLSRRSIQICRVVLRAALSDAVEEGELRRNPAAKTSVPRDVARHGLSRVVDAWDEDELERFLAVVDAHRWAGPIRLEARYGLRRSELLGLSWAKVDLNRPSIMIDRGLVEVRGRPTWSDGKNTRSRRTIPLDSDTSRALGRHKALQAEERLLAGRAWQDDNLVVATRQGRPVSPRNFDQTLERLIAKAGVPRLTSHGLRHTAATHMIRRASDLGEVRAIADLLGHSPDMLMRTYAHALPASVRAVVDKIGGP